MIKLGAGVVIVESGKVLFTKREDLEVWSLPGGRVDVGESLAEAAIREAREETGLEVEITHLIGLYSEIGSWNDWHIASFAARVVGGMLQRQSDEVLDIQYFAPDNLPDNMFWWHRRHVADYFAGAGGSAVWRQEIEVQPGAATRAALYAMRDDSGLSPSEFYKWYYESKGVGRMTEQGNGRKSNHEK